MQIYPVGSRPSQRASPDYFAGTVWQDPITMAPEPARLNALILHFEPSARTAWHTHPLGQTLHITQGSGLICKRGEKPQKIQAGDSVWIPANIEHWHGAGLTTHMTHIAIQETKEGSAAMWLEHVTDQDYKA